MAQGAIAGLTIIYHSAGQVNIPDDPAYGQFKLVARLSGVDFMSVREPSDEVIILRTLTQTAMEKAITRLDLRTHPRLKSLVVTGPQGEIEKIEKTPRS